MLSINSQWILCPLCGNKTRNKIREDTVLKNYPLYCPKCRQETLIEVENLQVTVIKEPDAQTAEPMNLRKLSQFIGSVTTFMLDFIACHRG